MWTSSPPTITTASEQHDAAEGQRHAAGQDEAVRDQGVGLITPAGAEGARDSGADAAAQGAGGGGDQQHPHGEDQRDARQDGRAESTEVEGVDGAGQGLDHDQDDGGHGQAHQRGQDGRLEEAHRARARRQRLAAC
jgi:hypothetical protein